MNLKEYINHHYKDSEYWFKDEVQRMIHINRINKILDNKEYLDGEHKILQRENETYNNKHFETRKIVLQYCKPILTFQTSFLLKNDVTLTSDDADTLEEYKNIYKKGKYNNLDFNILDKMLKYGECYEYIYYDGDKIKSELINAEDSYPIFNHKSEYIGFIEHYTVDNTEYYIIYSNEVVEEYKSVEGYIVKVAEYTNLTGLPIRYILSSEVDELEPRSDLEEWKGIIDNLEDLLSKNADSFYKFLNPIPIMTGTKLNTEKGGEINPHMVGHMLQLEDGSNFDFKLGKMDYQTFKEVYNTLHQSLLNISMTPSISMNSAEISNLSETSMKILFYMAISKGSINSKYLHKGFDERWKKIKRLLSQLGKEYKGYIDCVFKMDIPQNDTEIIDNLKTLKEINAISLESILSNSPYTTDIVQELDRLRQTEDESDILNDNVNENRKVELG